MKLLIVPLLIISLLVSVLSLAALMIVRINSSLDSGERCIFETAIDTLTSYEMLKWGLEMQTWEESSVEVGTIWPWEEIGDNLISYSQGEYNNRKLPKPVRIMTLCPVCHRPLHEIVYISPSWTWKSLCGREGDQIYCPHCRIQWLFDCRAMN